MIEQSKKVLNFQCPNNEKKKCVEDPKETKEFLASLIFPQKCIFPRQKSALINKAGYTATVVACGWAGAVLEKVTRASG